MADLYGLPAVALVGRHELDAAVAVPVVVPVHKRGHPLTGLVLAGEWSPWVVRPVFCRSEQRFGVGVVIGHPWPREGSEHAQLLQPALQRCGTHRVAVIGMQDQWLAPPLADPLSQAGSAYQIRCDVSRLHLGHIPGFQGPRQSHSFKTICLIRIELVIVSIILLSHYR